ESRAGTEAAAESPTREKTQSCCREPAPGKPGKETARPPRFQRRARPEKLLTEQVQTRKGWRKSNEGVAAVPTAHTGKRGGRRSRAKSSNRANTVRPSWQTWERTSR